MSTGKRSLNPRALVAVSALAMTALVGIVGSIAYHDRYGASGMLREAKGRLERKQPDLALSYLNRYLELKPDDLDALDLKARILAESVRDVLQVKEAMRIHNLILARDPDNPRWQPVRRRLVRLNLRVGYWRAAETLARELIKKGADDAEAHRMLAHALEGVGASDNDAKALDAARREYEKAERKEPGDVEGAERLANLYSDKLQDPQKALQVLDDLVKFNQNSPATAAKAYLSRARFLARRGEAKRTLADLDSAVKADPKNLEVRLEAALTLAERGDTLAARQHLNAIPAESRNDLRVKLAEGQVDLAEQQPNAAVQSWRAGLMQTGGTSEALTGQLAQLLLELGRFREAEPLIEQYRRLVGGEEASPRYHYLHGYLLFRTNRPREAIQELEAVRYKVDKALEPHLYFVLGQSYEAARDELKALDAYRHASELSQRWSAPWLAIAQLHMRADRANDAVSMLEKGLAAIPEDPQLLLTLSQIQWQQQARRPKAEQSWDELKRNLERARKVAPNSAELALLQADYLTTVGQLDDAVGLLQAAAQLHPKSVPLWLARVNVLGRMGQIPQALEALKEATAAAGPQAGFIVSRAALLIVQGHLKEARAALVGGLDQVPPDQKPMLWRELGQFYLKQDDLAAARQAFTEWARLQPGTIEPRAALLDLAFASGDEAAIHAEVEALKAIGGPKSPYWREARVKELLRDVPRKAPDPAAEKERLAEAERLIKEIQADDPRGPLPPLLEARLWEKRHRIGDAINAYERALDLKAGQAALVPLFALLVREHRDADIQRLRGKLAALPAAVEQIATVQALKMGDKDRAEQIAAEMVQENPQASSARLWQVKVLRSLGKPKEAEAALRRLIEQQPAQPDAWIQLLSLQANQHQASEVAQTIEQIRTRLRSNRQELLLAFCYRVAGDFARADEHYRAALKERPDDLAVRQSAIEYFEQTNRVAEAEESLRHLLKRDPALDWAVRKLALSLANHRNDRAAWDEALQLIGPSDRPDDSLEDRLARATVTARGPEPQHRQQALSMLEKLAAEQPRAAGVHELMARILLASGETARAREHAALAAQGEGATTEAVELYVTILTEAKAFDEAEKQLSRLAATDPNNLRVVELRARLLTARGQGRDAAALLEKSFADHAGMSDALFVGERIIQLLVLLKQLDAAERVVHQVGKLGPKGNLIVAQYWGAHGKPDEAAKAIGAAAESGDVADAVNVALALARAHQDDPRWLEQADQILATALKKQPDSIDLLLKQAFLRHFQRRYEEEVALYQAVLDRHPDRLQFLNNMAWTLSEGLNRPQEGLERADQLLKKAGREPHLLDTRGVILTRLGRLDEAVADLKAATASLSSGSSFFHLARAYLKKGDTEQSRKYRELAQRAGLKPEGLEPSERPGWKEVFESEGALR